MPVTDEDFKAVKDKADALEKALGEVRNTTGQLPGWLTRIESEVKGLKTQPPPEKEKESEKEKPEPKDERVAALEREVAAQRTEKLEARKQQEILAGTSGIAFYDTADVVQHLMPKVQTRDDGTHFVMSERVLEATGEKIKDEISVGEAVKRLASKDKKHWVKADVKGGAGAGSGNGSGGTEAIPDYATLLRNPNELSKWLAKDSAGVDAAEKKYYEERGKKK